MRLDKLLCRQYLGMDDDFWSEAEQTSHSLAQDVVCVSLYGEFERLLVCHSSITEANEICIHLIRHLAIFAPEHIHMAPAVFLGACLPLSLKRMRGQNIDEHIISDTFGDFARWATVYQSQHGHRGIGELPWVLYAFSGRLLQLGRLMYHQQPFPFPYYIFQHIDRKNLIVISAETSQNFDDSGLLLLLAPGMPVLDIHIPRQGPLLPDDVDASLAQAKEFYTQINYPAHVAICDSWLLDPALDIIAPNSNSAHFMRRFTKFTTDEATASIGKYIFGNDFAWNKLEKAPQTSRLQRSLKEYVDQGGKVQDTGGVLLLPS